MITQISHTEHNIEYTIGYDERDNSITFHAMHNIDFMEWSVTIVNNLIGMGEHVKVSLTPKNIFRIMQDYIRGELPNGYKIVMPIEQTYVGVLPIQIHSVMEYHDECDIKTIILEPVQVLLRHRFDRYVAQTEKKLGQKDKQIDELRSAFIQLCESIVNLCNGKEEIKPIVSDKEKLADWLRENNDPCGEKASIEAVLQDDLDILELLHAAGYPMNTDTCCMAASKGRFTILKWLHEKGVPWDESACTMAASEGKLIVLKYLHENGCPWDANACQYAASNGHLLSLIYLHENKCPWNKNCYKTERNNILEYLCNNECPTEWS